MALFHDDTCHELTSFERGWTVSSDGQLFPQAR